MLNEITIEAFNAKTNKAFSLERNSVVQYLAEELFPGTSFEFMRAINARASGTAAFQCCVSLIQ